MKTFADINKYKNEMLAEQQMMAQQEARQYATSEAYNKEGELPISAVPDSRSITQKLADMEYVKKIIINELKAIAEPQFAAEIVNAIMKSPLNVQGRLMRYMGNNIVEFIAQLKKKYGIGIRGDKNDVERMVDFINTLYLETSKTNKSVSDYVKSTSNQTIQNTMSKSNVDTILQELKSIILNFQTLDNRLRNGIQNEITMFEKIRDYIPTQGQVNQITELANQGVLNAQERQQVNRLENFMQILQRLPKPSIILNLIDTIKLNLRNNNNEGVDDALRRINEYTREFRDKSREFANIDNIMDTRTQQEQRQFLNNQDRIRREEQERENAQRVRVANWDDFGRMYGFPQQQQPPQLPQQPQLPIYGNGMKRRGRPVGSGMRYKPIGENEFNLDRFDEGIMTVRKAKNKRGIAELPSKRLSSNLKGIIKTISGGGLPEHNDINKLDDEEKEYLSKLVKSSKIDRLNVPTPSKDNREKLYHEFEVMKGQILAGNDNKDLVKEFKLLVRKLSKMRLLPKADADDVIDLLITLGY